MAKRILMIAVLAVVFVIAVIFAFNHCASQNAQDIFGIPTCLIVGLALFIVAAVILIWGLGFLLGVGVICAAVYVFYKLTCYMCAECPIIGFVMVVGGCFAAICFIRGCIGNKVA